MSLEINIFNVLSDTITRSIFHVIASERQVSYRKLLRSLEKSNIEIKDASESLRKLQQAKLIEEKDAPIRDLDTFYITANGLSLERELRKLDEKIELPSSNKHIVEAEAAAIK